MPVGNRPRSGSQSSSIANSICSMIANQNDATARPATETIRTTWSNGELCHTAARVPTRIPPTAAKARATSVSSMVAGRRSTMSSPTGRRE